MRNFLTLALCSLIIFSCATAQSAGKKKNNSKTAQAKLPELKKKKVGYIWNRGK